MSDLGEYVDARGDEVMAFCLALTGDPREARDLAASALPAATSRAVRRGEVGIDAAVWRSAARRFIRSRANRRATRRRVAAVLSQSESLSTHDIAVLLRWRRRRVERALRIHEPEQVPLAELVSERSTNLRRSTRRRLALGAVALVVTLPIALVVFLHARTPAQPLEALRPVTVGGLLTWPPRGDLRGDRSLLVTATRRVQAGLPTPIAHLHLLFAGHHAGGRLLVFEGIDSGGTAVMTSVGDETGATGETGLRIVTRAAIDDLAVPYVLIRYAGPDSDAAVDGGRRLSVLSAPGLSAMERRSAGPSALSSAGGLGTWTPLAFTDGLSRPWLDLSDAGPATALRPVGGGRETLVIGGTLVPFDMVTRTAFPAFGAASVRKDARRDDGLALAQVMHVPDVDLELLYSGSVLSAVDGSGGDSRIYRWSQHTDDCLDCRSIVTVGAPSFNPTSFPSQGLPAADVSIQARTQNAELTGKVLLLHFATGPSTQEVLIGQADMARCEFLGLNGRPGASPVFEDFLAGPVAVIDANQFFGGWRCRDRRGKVVAEQRPLRGYRA